MPPSRMGAPAVLIATLLILVGLGAYLKFINVSEALLVTIIIISTCTCLGATLLWSELRELATLLWSELRELKVSAAQVQSTVQHQTCRSS